jgi:hypothetical protein
MYKKVFKCFTLSAMVAAMCVCGTACQREDVKISDSNVSEVLSKDSVLTIDGKRMEWKFSLPQKRRSISKGVFLDERNYYESIVALCKQQYGSDYELLKTIDLSYKGEKYSVEFMRVDRKSEPGKYFYVMVDNLKVKLDTACWAYADDESYVEKYGRLYTWSAAEAFAKTQITYLPRYQKNNPKKKVIDNMDFPVRARLISKQDILDIIECDCFAETGYSIDNNIEADGHEDCFGIPFYYYDAFVGGLDNDSNGWDYSRGERVLTGCRNSIQQERQYWSFWIKGWYCEMNELGSIWLNDRSGNDKKEQFHYSLTFKKQNDYGDNFVSYISVATWDRYGFAVRYVFEPQYK